MDKTTILRTFLSHGSQLEESASDFLTKTPTILEHVLNLGNDKLPAVITLEFLKSLSITSEDDVSQKTSVTQLSKVLNHRYEFLRNLLVDKHELTNLISINRITEKIKQFSVIGVILEKNDTVTLEDTTGYATFILDKELAKYIVEDEVIGVVCERQGGLNKVKQVVYPDIPLNKENKKTEGLEKCFFISDIHMDTQTFKREYYRNLLNWLEKEKDLKIFVLGGIAENNEDVSKFLSDIPHPIHFYPKTDIGMKSTTTKIENINFLLANSSFFQHYLQLWGVELDTAIINLVKKRNLSPILTPKTYNNDFLLETIPDVIAVSGGTEPTATNYKGTTILMNGSFATKPIYWLINLQTRETFKIDFS